MTTRTPSGAPARPAPAPDPGRVIRIDGETAPLVDRLWARRGTIVDGVAAAAGRVVAVADELDAVPPPGGGRTADRLAVLSAAGAGDLSVARLLEGHLDATAILHEAGMPPPVDADGGLLGVWAADGPDGRVEAVRHGDAWRLRGTKRWCSGAQVLAAALVTAHADDGYRLFLVRRGDWRVGGSWPAAGMLGSGTLDADVDQAEALPVGDPGWYLSRPGFTAGGVGVAAVWVGAAMSCLDLMADRIADDAHPTALAHLGHVDAQVAAARALLGEAAAALDDPDGPPEGRAVLAHRVRAVAAAAAAEALHRTAAALGTRILVDDAAHARRAVDLPVYLSQHHGDRDLAALGRRVARGHNRG